jgi:hypothetical protein
MKGQARVLLAGVLALLLLVPGPLPAQEFPVQLEKSFSFANETLSGTFLQGEIPDHKALTFKTPF